jgi:hypothetical protein
MCLGVRTMKSSSSENRSDAQIAVAPIAGEIFAELLIPISLRAISQFFQHCTSNVPEDSQELTEGPKGTVLDHLVTGITPALSAIYRV